MVGSYKNFLIVGTQRTGSSALAESVNTHPRISCGWEWTETTPVQQKIRALESGLAGDFRHLDNKSRHHIETSISASTQWLGFRRLFGASNKWLLSPRYSLKLIWDRFDAHRRWLARHPEVRVVHIVRNNDIAWLKSKFVAKNLRAYVGTSYPEDTKVTVPIKEAVARIKAKHWLDQQLALLAGSNPYLRIDYETMAEDLPAQATRIVEFLDCAPDELQLDDTKIRKQSTKHDSEYIENYAELTAAIAQLRDNPGATTIDS